MSEEEEFETYQVQKEEEQLDLEQKNQLVEEEPENVDQRNDLEEQPLEWDIDEVASRVEIDELIAEYKMLEEELEEFLPLDALVLKEEDLEVENPHLDSEDSLIEVDLNQNVLVLEVEEKTLEIKEEPETYEIISSSVQKEEGEVLEQQELNIQTEQDIMEEFEGYELADQESESVLSCINQVIEELIAEKQFTEVELVRLERELEEIIEDKINRQQAEEIVEEVPKDIEETEQREEMQIDTNDTSMVEEGNYEESFMEIQSIDERIEDLSEFVTIEAIDYEKTTLNKEFDNDIQSQLPFTQSEINLLREVENLDDTLPQLSTDMLISQFMEITHSPLLSQQQSFDLSFDEHLKPSFSTDLLDGKVSSLEKILDELESPCLLGQFHFQMEEEIYQLFDNETHQICSEINPSLEMMVSQGPPLPEPPPYDFQVELAELEEELEEQERLSKSLLRSFHEGQKIQLAAIHNFNSSSRSSPQKRHYKSSAIKKPLNSKEKKNDPSLTLNELEKRILATGKLISLNSSYKDIKAYVGLWNEFVKIGGKLTQDLKMNFDEIVIKTNQKSLVRIKYLEQSEWMLRSQKDVNIARKYVNKWIPNAFLKAKMENRVTKIRTGTIIEWLKCRNKIKIKNNIIGEGAHKVYKKKSFFEISVQSKDGLSKTLFIPNKITQWNLDGFKSDNYSPSRNRKSQSAIANELLEPISYHSLTAVEKRQVFSKMQKIFPNLKKPTQIPSRYTIYQPQRNLELDIFDDLLVTKFCKSYISRGSVVFQRASNYTQELIEKQLKLVIKHITNNTFKGSKENYFNKDKVTNKEIAITTKSRSSKHTFKCSRTSEEKKSTVEWIIKKEAYEKDSDLQDKTSRKNELILLGASISSCSDTSLIDSYIKTWNNYVKRSETVDTELKKNFDTILNKIGKDKLVRIKLHNQHSWFLEKYIDVRLSQEKVNKWIPSAFFKEETTNYSSRARIPVILEWLKCRNKIKILAEYVGKGSYRINQKKSFFEIEVTDDEGNLKIFFIPNKITQWNPNGFKSGDYSPSRHNKSQSAIVLDLLESERYHTLSTDDKRQIFLKMKEIFPQLEQNTQIGSTYTIYKPQRNLNLNIFDDLLMTKFHNLYADRSPSQIIKQELNHIQELISKQPRLLKYITNQTFFASEGNFFNMVIVDREKALKIFKTKLKHQTKIDDISKDFHEFRKRVKELGLRRVSMIYEKARLEVAENIPSFHFTIENALEEGFEITDNYTNFWNEDHIDSFTGIAAGMMQNKDFRIKVLSKFNHLRINNEGETTINSDITGKDIATGGSISPDITVRKDEKIIEEVEVKQLRLIGRSMKDQTNPTMYWFDFFKTLETKGDPIRHISLHFVNKHDDVESMGWDCAKDGLGGVIIEAGELNGIPKRLNELITAFSYERWPSAHKIDRKPKTEKKELVIGIMERLATSAERKTQLKGVITKKEVEDFVRDVNIFPKDYKQHRGYVEILIYVLRKLLE